MESKPKKTLLERYGIPIHHLDFKYIAECQNAREMEKILHILRSNEEGYFPDLTQCAENKLRELKPNSRLFRVEEKIKGREALPEQEIKPIYDWNHEIKTTDKKLKNLAQKQATFEQMPPIRKTGTITQEKGTDNKNSSTASDNKMKETKPSQRIKSTDYDKWDKYDPEEEILRMELSEERQQEEVERKNRLNAEKMKEKPLIITEIVEETVSENAEKKWSNLSDIEKEKLSEEFRLRGNEYFRAKEYDHALLEYTRAIQVCPSKAVAAYNNRAVTYFKLQQFEDSIKDSQSSLKLEPQNVKARLRLAEANYAYGKRRESYQLYIDVLEVDAENAVALKAITELRKQFEDLPPPNATRLKIQEESAKPKVAEKKKDEENGSKPVKEKKPKPKSINYDLADLVKPNRLVKSTFQKTAETLGQKMQQHTFDTKKLKDKNEPNKQENLMKQNSQITKLCLPGTNQTAKMKKPLIEEI